MKKLPNYPDVLIKAMCFYSLPIYIQKHIIDEEKRKHRESLLGITDAARRLQDSFRATSVSVADLSIKLSDGIDKLPDQSKISRIRKYRSQ